MTGHVRQRSPLLRRHCGDNDDGGASPGGDLLRPSPTHVAVVAALAATFSAVVGFLKVAFFLTAAVSSERQLPAAHPVRASVLTVAYVLCGAAGSCLSAAPVSDV